jgi:hypothetical protein
MINEVDGDEKNGESVYDYDFEDDDNGDDWLACVYLTLVYHVCFGYGLRS